MSRLRNWSSDPIAAFLTATCLLVSMLLLGGVVHGRAQEATPATGVQPVLRAAIHTGLCDSVGEVVFPLADLVYGFELLADVPGPATPGPNQAAVVGPSEATAAVASVSVVAATIEELTQTPHSVNAVATVVDPMPPRVCGEIGGVRVGNDLVFRVGALSPTSYAGTAWLHENGDGTTTVALFLAAGLSGDRAPGSANDVEATVAVEADGSARLPGVPVGAQVAAVEIGGGAFTTGDVVVRMGQPVVLHVSNTDDRPYRVEILDLADAEPIAANDTGVIEFTVPTPETYVARLLPAEGQEVLDTFSLSVVPPEDVLP